MNRFIKYDDKLEKIITKVVKNNFPAVSISSLSGPSVESFAQNSMSRLSGGYKNHSIVESDGASTKTYMVWTTSRWGGSHIVR